MGINRSTNLTELTTRLKTLGLSLIIPSDIEVPCKDAADAVVACITLASNVINSNLESNWEEKLPGISEEEWNLRRDEGLILRIIGS